VDIVGLSLPMLDFATADLMAIGLTIVAGVAMFRLHLDVLRTLAICGGGAMLLHLVL